MSDFLKCECSHCGQSIEYPAEGTGQTAPCPTCENPVTLEVPSKSLSQTLSKEDNNIEGMEWGVKGARLGDVQSMSGLGACYLLGKGMPQNYTEAVKWLRLAADQGDIIAQGNLGVCYFHGYGVAQNFSMAEKLIRKAAEWGDASAQYHLGCMYHLGHGVPQSSLEGFSWWLKAAEQGDANAQNNVGFLYEQGEIVSQDLIEAHKWMSLAAAQGFEGANKDASEMVSKMSETQRHESMRRIEAFKIKNAGHKPTDNNSGSELITRLAALGDLESQAILMSQKGDLSAAANLMVKAIERDGILNICTPGAENWAEICNLGEDEPDFRRLPISSEVRREVWRRDEGKCVKCGSRERLEYDHIIPVSKGGSNTVRNIELLCESCNRTKSASIQ